MSDYEEMEGFIVEDPVVEEVSDEESEEHEVNRMFEMTSQLKPNESQQQKLLKAHISVLVSALGGPDHTSTASPAPYKLGHDALACLKDIKKWIKEVDERKGGFEVAMACADSGLVPNDLIPILCQWDSSKNTKYMEKILLSLLEILVLLTWPVELGPELTPDQRLLYPDIKKAQLVYKKHLLGPVIRAVIRLALPLVAKNRIDREPRDSSILRLVLFFIRNVLYIEPANSSLPSKSSKQIIASDNMPAGITYDDISMNTVLLEFKKNNGILFLLTVLGLLGTDFESDFAVICLECVFLLVRRVDPSETVSHENLKNQEQEENSQNANGNPEKSSGSTEPINISATAPLVSITTTAGMHLKDLLDTETKRKRAQTKTLQTRHGRFGSLILIRANDSTSYVVSGQEALHSTGSSLDKLDKTKKWNDRTHFKYDSDEFVARTEYLNESGRNIMCEFVEQFLSGGCFNNLVECISAHLSSVNDLEAIEEYEKASYFLTLSWFFHYKREKRDDLDFGSVGAALSEVNFILIISYLRQSYTGHKWSSLHAALICFNELLLISHSLFNIKRPDDDDDDSDRELAEGIIRKLFSYTDFISLIIQIPQTASKHSPTYLRVCISVVHIILKSFESFANEDIKLYVQTKRKQKKKVSSFNPLKEMIEMDLDDEEIEERMQQVKKERRLDFTVSEARFFHTSIVSTYIEYLSRFEDLSHEEIKRCISYFHRLFVVRKDYGGLFRLDFMHTLYKLRDYLPRGTSIRNHTDELLYYFMKKFKLAFSRFPLPLELLFPRFEDTESRTFLSTGELYMKPESKQSMPKLAKEVEFVREFPLDEQVKILISALYSQEKQSLIEWLADELFRIIKERTMDDSIVCQLNPTPQFKRLLINNPYIRMLIQMIGFELPYIMEDRVSLPSFLGLENLGGFLDLIKKLGNFLDLIKKWFEAQPVRFEDGKDAMYFLRNREPVYRDEDIEYNGNYEEDDETIAFVATGDNNTHNVEELDRLEEMERLLEGSGKSFSGQKGKAKKKLKQGTIERKEKLVAKNRPKKVRSRGPPRTFDMSDEDEPPLRSAEFIRDSDDESDAEKENIFFEREERLRNLLSDSGGIVNAQQLAEFKKVWSKLERSSGSSASIVAKAVKETSLFVGEDDNGSDGDVSVEEPWQDVSTKRMVPSETESEAEDEVLPALATHNTNVEEDFSDDEIPVRTKRHLPNDDSDSEEDTSLDPTTGIDEVTKAESVNGPSRKKQLVVSDDED